MVQEVIQDSFVKRLNRYFHDEEACFFSDRHESRMKEESVFYADFFKEYFAGGTRHVRILDIASGTGLVGKTLPENRCHFICADISTAMLKRARGNLSSTTSNRFDYVSCDAENLPFGSGVFDLVICNAAMHHFPSTERFTNELRRVLKTAGVLIIGFEANRRFWRTMPVSLLYRLASRVAPSDKEGGIGYDEICRRVNARLLEEGLIDERLSKTDILKYVDIHSPNAGERLDYSKGFDIPGLLNSAFKDYDHRVVYHYGSLPNYIRILSRTLFYGSAPKFSLILKKRRP